MVQQVRRLQSCIAFAGAHSNSKGSGHCLQMVRFQINPLFIAFTNLFDLIQVPFCQLEWQVLSRRQVYSEAWQWRGVEHLARTLVLPQTHNYEGATYSIYGQPGKWSRTWQLKHYAFSYLCHKKWIYADLYATQTCSKSTYFNRTFWL